MRVALYARYSTDRQRDSSIEDQIRVCRTRADNEGWLVIETYADHATSSATILRPGYQALIAVLRSGDIDVVLAESLDRFSRDLEHIASFFEQRTFHKVRIVTLAEGDISELHIGLKGTMGALFLKDLVTRRDVGSKGAFISAGTLMVLPTATVWYASSRTAENLIVVFEQSIPSKQSWFVASSKRMSPVCQSTQDRPHTQCRGHQGPRRKRVVQLNGSWTGRAGRMGCCGTNSILGDWSGAGA